MRRTIDAEIVEEEVVTCKNCGQKNRLYKRARHGIYRCGSCRAALASPFVRHSKPKSAGAAIFGWGGLALVVLIGLGASLGGSRQPTTPSFVQPSLATPPNGEAFTYTNQERIAPFEIKSTRGSNYLVKLANAVSGQPVQTIFVRGGETINIDVPLGTFIVKYASGDTWYGYDYLFGDKTSYSKASKDFKFERSADQVHGYTITLYKVPYGNLHTERIKPNEF